MDVHASPTSQQTDAFRQMQVKTYYCPSRRGPADGLVHQAEQVYPGDTTPPPEFTATGTADARFSGPNQPPGALGDYAGNLGEYGYFATPPVEIWSGTDANGALIAGHAEHGDGQITSNTEICDRSPTGRATRSWSGRSTSRRGCSGG